MFKRIPQPPVNPALRSREHHDFWTGLVIVFIGLVLVFCGVRNATTLDTVEGSAANELQLMKAFSSGGLQYTDLSKPPAPGRSDDPAAAAEALDRWARQQASAAAPRWKIRVDTGAKTPCPT